MALSLTILSFPVLHAFIFSIYALDLEMKGTFLKGHITCFGKCIVWVGGSDWDINNTVFSWWQGKAVILFILTLKNFLSGFSFSQLPSLKDGYKAERTQVYRRHSTNTSFFSRNLLCVITHYQHTEVLYTLSLLSWFLTFIFISVLSPCSKYPSKSWFILVDRICHLLFKYSELFFRPSLNLLIFQGEISLFSEKEQRESII